MTYYIVRFIVWFLSYTYTFSYPLHGDKVLSLLRVSVVADMRLMILHCRAKMLPTKAKFNSFALGTFTLTSGTCVN